MESASFQHFLEIKGDAKTISFSHELRKNAAGNISAHLSSITSSGISGIRREKIHASVDFPSDSCTTPSPLPADLASSLEGICYRLPAEKLYEELVPFGKAYRNVQGQVLLTPSGALAQVYAPNHSAPTAPLGSPFPFDAVMHLACAWSQRFRRIVAFPVGFASRRIFLPTQAGETYYGRVVPVSVAGDTLIFDMGIYDAMGNPREIINGIQMKDVSGGKAVPPPWIIADTNDSLPNIKKHCRALAVMETETMCNFASLALSPSENERFQGMGARRKQSYLSGRLALKAIARLLAADSTTPAPAINTIDTDGIRPCCTALTENKSLFSSLSHDRRFAIAVAAEEAIGVDVEYLSERVLKGRHLYMDTKEIAMTDASPLGSIAASLRVWSIKECLTKAANTPITAAWKHVSVKESGESESHFMWNGQYYTAWHDMVDDHLFTLVKGKFEGLLKGST
jgi:4'-phosphopantetheinyl transferase EntD